MSPAPSDDMIWEDPPADGRRRGKAWTPTFIAACREHPGKWARVITPDGIDEHGSSTHANLRRAGLELRSTIVRPDGSHTPSGRMLLWARWPDDE